MSFRQIKSFDLSELENMEYEVISEEEAKELAEESAMLKEIFVDINKLVEESRAPLEEIETKTEACIHNVDRGNKHLVKATTLQTFNSYYQTGAAGSSSVLKDGSHVTRASSFIASAPASVSDIYYYDQDSTDHTGTGNYIFNFSRGMTSRYLNMNCKDQIKSAKIQFNGQNRICPLN